MSNEYILRWIVDFGMGWVGAERLKDSWGWRHIDLLDALNGGLLIHKTWQYKLTTKSIKQLEGDRHE